MTKPPDAQRLAALRDGLQRLHDDAKRWLAESLDRPNLRAAELRIAKLLAFAEGNADEQIVIRGPSTPDEIEQCKKAISEMPPQRLEIRNEPDDFTSRVLEILRSPAGRIAIAEALRSPLMLKPDGTWREADGDRIAPRIEIANNLVPDAVLRAFDTPTGKEILREVLQRRPVFGDRGPDPSSFTRDADEALVAPIHPDGCHCADCCRRKFSETKTWGEAPIADGNPWAPDVDRDPGDEEPQ